jgi:hypothetical protein
MNRLGQPLFAVVRAELAKTECDVALAGNSIPGKAMNRFGVLSHGRHAWRVRGDEASGVHAFGSSHDF